MRLTILQEKFKNNISKLSETEYKKEFERLAIDLSWKSSQIEGNTYSLLETEKLLKEKETAGLAEFNDGAALDGRGAAQADGRADPIRFIAAKSEIILSVNIDQIVIQHEGRSGRGSGSQWHGGITRSREPRVLRLLHGLGFIVF